MYSPQQLSDLYDKTFSENNFPTGPAGLYKPVEHIMGMHGKRIRPLLLLMSCDAFNGDTETALNPAFAVEVFHNFTLVHDDIMDNADIRRGMPTVHKQFGLNAGILAGDVMLAYAYQYLARVPAQNIPYLLAAFNKTAIEIFEGQQMDMDFEQRADVSEAEYLKMIECKTSVLLGCCAQMGAIIAGAGVENQQLIYDFGLKLGLSFQIKDDYLDAFGDGEKVGKKIGGDILQNKKTYLFITALHSANIKQRDELNTLLHEKDPDKKIAGVKSIFEATGARQKAMAKADELYHEALGSLQKVAIDESAKKPLAAIADKINSRDF